MAAVLHPNKDTTWYIVWCCYGKALGSRSLLSKPNPPSKGSLGYLTCNEHIVFLHHAIISKLIYIISYLICIMQSHEYLWNETRYSEKGKHRFSSFWKAFHISSTCLSFHRHFKGCALFQVYVKFSSKAKSLLIIID